MSIVNRVAKAICDYQDRGIKADVLVIGNSEAEELRVLCSQHLAFECENIGGWEYQGLKVIRISEDTYLGLSVAQENEEESQPLRTTSKVSPLVK